MTDALLCHNVPQPLVEITLCHTKRIYVSAEHQMDCEQGHMTLICTMYIRP